MPTSSPAPVARSPSDSPPQLSNCPPIPALPIAEPLVPMTSDISAVSSDFFSTLLSHLSCTYPETTAREIVRLFREAHTRNINGLSLDECAILARSVARARGGAAGSKTGQSSQESRSQQPDESDRMVLD